GQREDVVLNGRAERLRYGEGEDDRGNREEYVGDAHQRLAKPALPPSGDEADRNTDRERGPDRRDGDRECDASAEQDAAVDIGAHPVGAEEIGFRWRQQPLARVHVPHRFRMRGNERRQDRDSNEQENDHEASCRGGMAEQFAQDMQRGFHAVGSGGSSTAWPMSTSRFTIPNTTPA